LVALKAGKAAATAGEVDGDDVQLRVVMSALGARPRLDAEDRYSVN
jgi:hypothetical protein